MKNEVFLTDVLFNELEALQAICNEIYTIYFGSHWENQGLERYLREQFGVDALGADLKDRAICYYFIWYGDTIVGFIKINYEAIFEKFPKETTCELEKMYIFPIYKGKGIGRIALKSIIDKACEKRKKILFLDVLETNGEAIRFYEKIGFKLHGKTRLQYTDFKEALKGLNRMNLVLSEMM